MIPACDRQTSDRQNQSWLIQEAILTRGNKTLTWRDAAATDQVVVIPRIVVIVSVIWFCV